MGDFQRHAVWRSGDAVRVLRRLEWTGRVTVSLTLPDEVHEFACCPICRGIKPRSEMELRRHPWPDCALAYPVDHAEHCILASALR